MNLKSKFFALFLSFALMVGISATAFNNSNAYSNSGDKTERVYMNGHWWIITYGTDGGVIEVHLDDFDE